MAALRYRWLLPAAHAAIDLALALMLVHRTHVEMERERPIRSQQEFRVVEATWQPGTEGWDPRELPLPDEVSAIALGTAPVGIVASVLAPHARFFARDQAVDERWFALHTGMALLVWYAIGRWLDRSKQKWLRISVLSHLGFRACAAPLMLFAGTEYSLLARIPTALLSLAWCALAVYLLWTVAAHVLRKARGC